MTFEGWWSVNRLVTNDGAEDRMVRAAWDTAIQRAIKLILEKAARQEHFAGPEYVQNTEADRKAFRHAAAMLRMLITELKK